MDSWGAEVSNGSEESLAAEPNPRALRRAARPGLGFRRWRAMDLTAGGVALPLVRVEEAVPSMAVGPLCRREPGGWSSRRSVDRSEKVRMGSGGAWATCCRSGAGADMGASNPGSFFWARGA